MAVCSASVIAMLGRVASDHRDELWREQEPSPITGAASAASSDMPAMGLAPLRCDPGTF